MKLIIAGCRDADLINDSIATPANDPDQGNIGRVIYHMLGDKIQTIEEIVHGDSGIVDQSGALWASLFNKKIAKFPAEWDLHGEAAGPIRNRQMAQYADELLALWDGKSRGTKNMIDEMLKAGKPIHIYPVSRYTL